MVAAATRETVDEFPLERYEQAMAVSAARDAAILHRCTADRSGAARFLGLTGDVDRPVETLVIRRSRPQVPARRTRPAGGTLATTGRPAATSDIASR